MLHTILAYTALVGGIALFALLTFGWDRVLRVKDWLTIRAFNAWEDVREFVALKWPFMRVKTHKRDIGVTIDVMDALHHMSTAHRYPEFDFAVADDLAPDRARRREQERRDQRWRAITKEASHG